MREEERERDRGYKYNQLHFRLLLYFVGFYCSYDVKKAI